MKKYVYITFSLLIIGAFIIFFMQPSNEMSKEPATQPEQDMQQEFEDHEVNDESDTSKENQKQEEDTDQTGFPPNISGALQNTISFFSNQETKIVAIGDSLTQGVGDETDQGGYIGILDRTINDGLQSVEIVNFGKRGNRTDQLLKRLGQEKIAREIADSDLVLITIGANDIMKIARENIMHLVIDDFVAEMDGYESRIRQIFETIIALNPDTHIYLVGFYNPFQQYFKDIKELDLIVGAWNTASSNIASEYENITFIPTEDLFTVKATNLFAEDNFHPNYEGYYLIAERVLDYITNRR
ncbi:SGNH/GDSL hydrolase family protein [Oceanobacillus profundus]|uniref:SGNH/GDSL hydrolase family protein n=1 Tax=Oceanobacillus sp. FSL W7-1304 TaxID=2975322 RepID=UPI001F032657|nr:SGNH/GDSL hydrolase family protein [Oceanobacillus profundus]MDO6450142.1 SGNH/GDSL hydrolase family protein [Oceanobacillus profundus]